MYEAVIVVKATIQSVDDVDMVLEDIHGLFEEECSTHLIGIYGKEDEDE
jgi:hypothetical protein